MQKANKKQQVKTVKTANTQTQANTLNNIASIVSYVASLNNKLVTTQQVTGYIALKYANKTILELHNKKRSTEHITFSNKDECFAMAKEAGIITRVVADSYGWRLNTEVLLLEDAQKYVKTIVDSLIQQYAKQFNAKNNTQQAKQAKQA